MSITEGEKLPVQFVKKKSSLKLDSQPQAYLTIPTFFIWWLRIRLMRKSNLIKTFTNSMLFTLFIVSLSRAKYKQQWCCKCGKEATLFCSTLTGHKTFLMGDSSTKLCSDLQLSKKRNDVALATIIKKRKAAKTHLLQLNHALEAFKVSIKTLESENDPHHEEMITILEKSSIKDDGDETTKSFFRKILQSSSILKGELEELKILEATFLDHINTSTEMCIQIDDQTILSLEPGHEEQPKKLGIVSRVLLSTLTELQKVHQQGKLGRSPGWILKKKTSKICLKKEFSP